MMRSPDAARTAWVLWAIATGIVPLPAVAQPDPKAADKDLADPASEESRQTAERQLAGRVVLASDPDQGVSDIRVHGYAKDLRLHRSFLFARTDANGRFTGKLFPAAAAVGAYSKDRTLGAIQHLEAGQTEVVLQLAPTTTIHGVLKDEQSKQPAANRRVAVSMYLSEESRQSSSFFGAVGISDEAGHFQLRGLVPGFDYRVSAETADDGKGKPQNPIIGHAKPTSAEEVDLGELIIPKPYRPPTFEEYVARNYLKKSPDERLKRGLTLANLGSVRLLLIAIEPNGDAARQFFRFRYEYAYNVKRRSHEETHRLLYEFIPLSLAPSESRAFMARHDIAAPAEDDATFAIFDSDGSIVAQTTFGELKQDGEFDPNLLAEFLSSHRHPPLSGAHDVLEDALAEAVRENKRVLVQIGGPACGKCYLLSQYFDEQTELISLDYVHVKLDSRMPEFKEVYQELSEGNPRGAPWMTILDADGGTMITGDTEEGNIGYPIHQIGIAHFERMLRKTRQRLTDDQLTTLLVALRKRGGKK